MTEQSPETIDPGTAAATHANSINVGDTVDYKGALGAIRGVVTKVRNLFDEGGKELRAFEVRVEGFVEHILTSADALTKVDEADGSAETAESSAPVVRGGAPTPGEQPAAIARSAYADTTVPPATDDREAQEPGSVDTWEK